MPEQKLQKNLSLMNLIAMSSGAVIGGWLAEAPYWFSVTGIGAAIIFPILGLLLVPVGLAFAELTAMLPFTSAIDVWTTNAFGHKAGWGAQWLMFLIQVVEPPMMAFIFITALNYFIPIPPESHMYIAMGIIVLWYILSNFNISLTGNLATIFFFTMIVISLLVAVSFYTSGSWSTSNFTQHGGMFPKGGKGVFVGFAVFSLKFIGFEMTPTLVQETNFDPKNMWKVILAALFIPSILYFIVVFAMGGMAPWTEISAMSMPEPEIVANLGLPKIIGIAAIVSGILHALTTLMGFWTSSARVLYGAAQLNQLPKAFRKINKYGQPYIANLVVLLFSLFFALFTGDNWVQYIYAISSVAAGAVYIISSLDAIVLRKKHPEWERPYRAPGGNGFLAIGVVSGAVILVGALSELDKGGYISLAIFLLVGVITSLVMDSYRKKNPEDMALRTLTPEDISKDDF